MKAKGFLMILVTAVFLLTSNTAASEGSFLTLPTQEDISVHNTFSDHFGWIHVPNTGHGIDYLMPSGTILVSAGNGIVTRVEDDLPNLLDNQKNYSGGYGNRITINLGIINGATWEIIYGHISPNCFVKVGEYVLRGQTIAKSGHNGYSTAPHLHFEVRKNGVNVDPYNPDNWLWTTNPPSHAYLNHSVIKPSNSHKVYLLSNNQLWWIPDEETYRLLGYTTTTCGSEADWSQVQKA